MLVDGDRLVIDPVHGAIWLSVYGEKLAKLALNELEFIGVREQERYVEK